MACCATRGVVLSDRDLAGRVALAFAPTFMIGFERELRGSPAGDELWIAGSVLQRLGVARVVVCCGRSCERMHEQPNQRVGARGSEEVGGVGPWVGFAIFAADVSRALGGAARLSNPAGADGVQLGSVCRSIRWSSGRGRWSSLWRASLTGVAAPWARHWRAVAGSRAARTIPPQRR